jgi:hypothetical protein
MARKQARRRGRERVAGIGLAILGLVVLAVAVFAIRNPRNGSPVAAAASSTPPSSSSPAAPSTPSSPPSTSPVTQPTDVVPITAGSATRMTLAQAQQVPLIVLNNTTITGLARQAATRFRLAGWTVTRAGNLINDILSTCAYYDPSDPKAEAAARVLKHEFPTIKRVRPKFPQLPVGPVVVVLTPDYAPQ